jgi:outer membrane receptor protein involved in Fe transport
VKLTKGQVLLALTKHYPGVTEYALANAIGKSKQNVLGMAILGTSKSFAFDSNDLIQPGFAYFNLLASVGLTEGLSLSLNVNNLFDTVGITEVNGIDGAAINGTDRYVRARSITGRSSAVSLQYKF